MHRVLPHSLIMHKLQEFLGFIDQHEVTSAIAGARNVTINFQYDIQ